MGYFLTLSGRDRKTPKNHIGEKKKYLKINFQIKGYYSEIQGIKNISN
jgi:hypothetical protein